MSLYRLATALGRIAAARAREQAKQDRERRAVAIAPPLPIPTEPDQLRRFVSSLELELAYLLDDGETDTFAKWSRVCGLVWDGEHPEPAKVAHELQTVVRALRARLLEHRETAA